MTRERLISVGVVLACCVLLVASVLAFKRGTAAYNATVAYKTLFWLGVVASLVFIRGTGGDPPRPKAILATALMAAVFAFAALSSPASQVSFLRLDMYLSFLMFGFVLCHAFGRPDRFTVSSLLLVLALVHALLLAIALVAAAAHTLAAPFVPPYFGNVRHLGYLGFVAASATLALTLLDERLRATSLFLTIYALFGVIAFGSRGALVAWLASVVVLAWLSGSPGRVVRMAVPAFGIALGAGYVAEVAGWFGADSLFDREVLDEGIAAGSYGRLDVWLESWRSYLAQPLLGYGPEGFAIAGVTKGRFAQPHNVVLQVLLESGVAGLLAVILFAWVTLAPRFYAAFQASRQKRLSDEEAGVIALLAGFLSYGMIDGVFYHALPLLCFVMVLALWIAMRSLTRSPASSPGT